MLHYAALRVGGGVHEMVQFNGPVLDLMTAASARSDPRLANLGPDLAAPAPFDEGQFLRRLREDDPTRGLGDALLDQHVVVGIGKFWKSEACWLAGLDPWTPAGRRHRRRGAGRGSRHRPLMQESARHGRQSAYCVIYDKARLPCPHCGPPALIRAH